MSKVICNCNIFVQTKYTHGPSDCRVATLRINFEGSFGAHDLEIVLIGMLCHLNNSNNRPRKHIRTICLTNRQIKRVNTCTWWSCVQQIQISILYYIFNHHGIIFEHTVHTVCSGCCLVTVCDGMDRALAWNNKCMIIFWYFEWGMV